MPVTLYGVAPSPPCRAVIILAEALGLPLEIKKTDLAKGDNLTPEYLKINQLHSIPSLDDNGTIVVDSHAILAYLATKYGKDDSLYPRDLVKKALVDSKLHFDTGYAFSILRRTVRAHKHGGQIETFTPQQTREIQEVYHFMNEFLEDNKFLVGDSVTVADISLYSTITTLENLIPIDNDKFPNVRRWLSDAETVPFFNVNKAGLEENRLNWLATSSH